MKQALQQRLWWTDSLRYNIHSPRSIWWEYWRVFVFTAFWEKGYICNNLNNGGRQNISAQNFNKHNLWSHVPLKVKNLSLILNSLQPWGMQMKVKTGWKSWQHRIKLHFFKFCAVDLNICSQRVFPGYFKGWKQRASLFSWLFWFSSNLMCCLQISQSSICVKQWQGLWPTIDVQPFWMISYLVLMGRKPPSCLCHLKTGWLHLISICNVHTVECKICPNNMNICYFSDGGVLKAASPLGCQCQCV